MIDSMLLNQVALLNLSFENQNLKEIILLEEE
jgi:hypothetical protein